MCHLPPSGQGNQGTNQIAGHPACQGHLLGNICCSCESLVGRGWSSDQEDSLATINFWKFWTILGSGWLEQMKVAMVAKRG